MLFCAGLALAFGLDLLLGDPRWYPHPVRLIGALCVRCEAFCRRHIDSPRRAGLATGLAVLLATAASCGAIFYLLWILASPLLFAGAVLVLYTTLATKDLSRHALAVHEALVSGGGDFFLARQRVGMIVGRDTRTLDLAGIVRACVESVAENMSDGVIAPLFWALLGGLALGDSPWALPAAATTAMLYKAANTMDSMFGYKNSQYLHFGWFAARFDDLVNFLPARLTALAIVLAAPLAGGSLWRALKIMLRDHQRHLSPNSGYPEAAMAGALGIRLGGPNVYFGQIVDKPFIGEPLHPPHAEHIQQANRLMLAASLLSGVLFCATYLAVTCGS